MELLRIRSQGQSSAAGLEHRPEVAGLRNRRNSCASNPAVHRVLPLASLCAQSLVAQIEKGFLGLGSRNPQHSGVPHRAEDARRFFFKKQARRILERLDRDGVLAKFVLQDSASPSTALYCACATLYCISSYSVSCRFATTFDYNRALDLQTIKYIGGTWINLRNLIFKGSSIDKEYLDILASGKARKTLEKLDLSLTFVDDDALSSLEKFENLVELRLNGCPEITTRGLEAIVHGCPKLRVLCLSNSEIPLNQALQTLSGPSRPLPELRELFMETDQWPRHMHALLQFCETRYHLHKLKIWAIIPKLEYMDPATCSQLIRKAPWRKVHLKDEGFSHIHLVPKLKILQLQLALVDQTAANTIGRDCRRLLSFVLTSAKFPKSEVVNLNVLNRLEELALVDCELGMLASLPRRLKSLTVTIRSIENSPCADTFLSAICRCIHLRKLHIFAAESAFKTASFKHEAISELILSLPRLEDLGLDRDLFGRDCFSKERAVPVPIHHNNLLSIKIISSSEPNVLPFVQFAPQLLAFEATDHFESIASIENISRYSLNIRSINLRFDRQQLDIAESQSARSNCMSNDNLLSPITPRHLLRKRSNSVMNLKSAQGSSPAPKLRDAYPKNTPHRNLARVISDCFKKLNSLFVVSLFGATQKVTSSLIVLRQLRKLHLNNCVLPTETLNRLASELPTIRGFRIHRCDGLDSISGLRSDKLAVLRVSSCPMLKGDVTISGKFLPRLEICDISNQLNLSSVQIHDLPQIRIATIKNAECSGDGIKISNVPLMTELVLESVTTRTVYVEAPALHRLFVECSQHVDESGECHSIDIEIKACQLRRISWHVEDAKPLLVLPLLKVSSDLDRLEFPYFATDDVDPLKDTIRNSCRKVTTIGCSDGDVEIASPTPATGEK